MLEDEKIIQLALKQIKDAFAKHQIEPRFKLRTERILRENGITNELVVKKAVESLNYYKYFKVDDRDFSLPSEKRCVCSFLIPFRESEDCMFYVKFSVSTDVFVYSAHISTSQIDKTWNKRGD
ncbi:hypothetical protein BKQ19_05260 [Lacticaseibacillus paracasei]|uniref:hypothetical protein n=1 Tax=Lacticaseibacillus paracasei TaxID=1597 RepID=UPI000343CC1C|nr:hypothetical protein [Lacticaseibacillus paracasei]ASU12188.1 hypothetical protein BKQ19_05260 [Lacticaseibacillus paracasei]EPD06112.1 hypothetical protein Lpp78_05196 [Lacticaseibacillus paracasei subsp. paracasei CNCM I-2877]MCT3377846.1 hypothetical protein [Lacticaseibacillus paracasei]